MISPYPVEAQIATWKYLIDTGYTWYFNVSCSVTIHSNLMVGKENFEAFMNGMESRIIAWIWRQWSHIGILSNWIYKNVTKSRWYLNQMSLVVYGVALEQN